MARGDVVIGRIAFTPADWQTIRLIRAEPYSARCARLAERLYLSHNGAKKRLDHLRLQTGTSSVDELLEWVWRNGKLIDQAVAGSAGHERPGLPLGSGSAAPAGSGDRPAAPVPAAWPAWGTSPEVPLLETVVHSPGDNKDVNRRQLLIDLGVLGLAAPLAGIEGVRQGLAAAFAGGHAAHIDEWDAILQEYAHSYYVTPTHQVLRDLAADLSVLQFQVGTADAALQRGLARVGAYLAVIYAKAWVDAGDLRNADRWWRTARQLADRSGDAEARTWVRAWEVTFGLYQQRPVTIILDRAAEVTPIAEPLVSVGSAQLYGGLAQTLALAGREDEALAALRRVTSLTEQLPDSVVADGDSMLGWPEVRLRHTESYVHTWLGNTGRANAAQEAALAIYPESLARQQAAVLLHRSTCMIHDGDVGGGLVYAGQVLEGLPTEHHTAIVRTTAQAVVQAVPEQERGRPEVADLRARLAFSPA